MVIENDTLCILKNNTKITWYCLAIVYVKSINTLTFENGSLAQLDKSSDLLFSNATS